jgi:hypothetical protein
MLVMGEDATASGLVMLTCDSYGGALLETGSGSVAHSGGYFFVRFLNLKPNPHGTLHTKQTVTMFLTVNSTGDQFSGPYDVQVVNASGDKISTSKGTVNGKLIAHPLLP